MSKSVLAGKLLRSSSAATMSQVWRMGVMFGTQMVLRRLVAPDVWGFWHWAVDFLLLIFGQVRDLGLPAHVVRDKERPYGAFLAVELVWGAVLSLALFAASPLIVKLSPEADSLSSVWLQALVLFFFFEGIGKVPQTYFEAEIQIDRTIGPEIARNLAYAVVSIGLAWANFGIVSLIVGHVAGSAVFAGLLWWRSYKEMPLTWPAGGIAEHIRPSLPLMLMAMLLLSIETVDFQIMSLSPMVTSEVAGLYGGTLVLASLVMRALEYPLRRALYPTFVAVRDDPVRFFETYRLATVFLMAIHIPVAGLLLTNAGTLLGLVWGDEYLPAAPFLMLLGLVPLVQPFTRCAEDVLVPRHEERILTAASAINLISLVGLGFLLIHWLGPVGMAWAKIFPLGAIVVTWAVYRVDPRGFRRLVVDLLKMYGIGGVFFGLAWWLVGSPGWTRLALAVLAGGLSFLVYVGLFGRQFREFFQTSET